MDKELFDKLARLRIKEREIKDEIDEIYPSVTESVEELPDGTVIESDLGKFTVSHRRTWEYSHEYEKQKEDLKKKQKEEEQKGLATYTTKASVVFKENK